MAYAVLQTDLTEPSEAQLRQAFEAVPALTAHDARVLARHAVGLLARGIDADGAAALVGGLEAQGVAAAAVDESELPALPSPYRLRMAACSPDGLTVYDAMNRPHDLPWSAVRIVAAGWVTQTEAEARSVVR